MVPGRALVLWVSRPSKAGSCSLPAGMLCLDRHWFRVQDRTLFWFWGTRWTLGHWVPHGAKRPQGSGTGWNGLPLLRCQSPMPGGSLFCRCAPYVPGCGGEAGPVCGRDGGGPGSDHSHRGRGGEGPPQHMGSQAHHRSRLRPSFPPHGTHYVALWSGSKCGSEGRGQGWRHYFRVARTAWHLTGASLGMVLPCAPRVGVVCLECLCSLVPLRLVVCVLVLLVLPCAR